MKQTTLTFHSYAASIRSSFSTRDNRATPPHKHRRDKWQPHDFTSKGLKLVLEINWCRTIKRNRINLPILNRRYWVSSIGSVAFAEEVSGNSPHYIKRAQLAQPLCPATYTLCKVTSRFVWGTWDWYACGQNCARSSRDAIYNSYPLVGLHRQNENEI